ncbi:MAG: cupin domain-containing protein [Halobacteria archaeon]|nr:cupin domain-containing protein [Halobacteria archaeon]
MKTATKDESPSLTRGDGLVSHLLHTASDDVPDTQLTVTWVEVEPGASQMEHSHEPEQVYVIVSGEGIMRVGEDERRVESGDLARIPSNTEHGIENTGDTTLEYVSAATPSFPIEEVEEFYGEDS